MTVQELIRLDSHKVRNSNDLMAFYLEVFESQFGRKPNCAGCTFKNDWNKLVNAVKTESTNTFRIMAKTDKTFELNKKEGSRIFTYVDKKRPVRTYGRNMTEEFANKLLSTGTKAQIDENKKAFKTLPASLRDDNATIEVEGEKVSLASATHKQLDAYAAEKEIDLAGATKVDEKRAVIGKTL